MEGLAIDGEAATPATLIDTGPMELAAEILARIKAECGLSGRRKKKLIVAFHFLRRQGRVEMRAVQTAGAGSDATVRMVAGRRRGAAGEWCGREGGRATEECPEVAGDAAERGVAGEVFHLEDGGRRGPDGDARQKRRMRF